MTSGRSQWKNLMMTTTNRGHARNKSTLVVFFSIQFQTSVASLSDGMSEGWCFPWKKRRQKIGIANFIQSPFVPCDTPLKTKKICVFVPASDSTYPNAIRLCMLHHQFTAIFLDPTLGFGISGKSLDHPQTYTTGTG